MKYVMMIALLFTFSIGKAQSFDFRIDHYAMIVKDLGKTGDFYASVLGLEDIPHPANAEGFRWFSIDGNSQLHLIQKDSVSGSRSKSEHLCLSAANLDEFTAYLRERNIPFWNWEGDPGAVTTRADGVHQIYLQDPEGNWIEVNDSKGRVD